MKKDIILIFAAIMLFVGFQILSSSQTITTGEILNGIEVIEKSDFNLRLSVEIADLKLNQVNTSEGDFVQVIIDGFARSHRVGAPTLPVINRLFSIPFDCELSATIEDYSIEEISLSACGLTDPVIPAQPPLFKSQNPDQIPFEFDKDQYTTDRYYRPLSVETEIIGTMRALRLGKISIAPVEYNPISNTLRVYKKMTVNIQFNHPDLQTTQEVQRKYYSPFFEPIYSRIINYDKTDSRADITTYPVKYVIVSDPMFESQLQPFITWKKQKGFNVIEAYTDEIGDGSNLAIKDYLQNLYESATEDNPAPSFVLLVGDAPQIPPFAGMKQTERAAYTDLYFCEYTDDFLPEVYYGRFSANDSAELQTQIDKTITYEKLNLPDTSYLANVTLIGGVESNYGPTYLNGQMLYGAVHYFNPDSVIPPIYSNTLLYNGSAPYINSNTPDAKDTIINSINNGIGFLNYTGHGSHNSWLDHPGEPEERQWEITIDDIDLLNGNMKYSLGIGNCCLSNTFADVSGPCFGEAWMQVSDAGGIGYIGATAPTLYDGDFWWAVGGCWFLDIDGSIFPYNDTTLGMYDGLFHNHNEPDNLHYVVNAAANFCGNLAVAQGVEIHIGSPYEVFFITVDEYYWEIYHLLGDPSVSTYLGVPLENNVDYIDTITRCDTAVTVYAHPGSYIGISFNEQLHGAGFVGESGYTEVGILPFEPTGEATIIVTGQNRKPYTGSIAVINCEFVCGDTDGDDIVNIFDITKLISFLYLNGPPLYPSERGNINGDDKINIFDITYLISYLYLEGPEPVCP